MTGDQMTIQNTGGITNMSKKFILAILPAIMVLAGCGAKPAAKDGMYEDTLAHDEIFGSLASSAMVERRLQPKRAYGDGVDKPYSPIVGYQRKTNNDGTFSVRFFATVESTAVEAYWTRSVHDLTGSTTNGRARGEKAVNSVYQALNGSNGSTLSAIDVKEIDDDAESKPFNYFAVYCLLNIPSNLTDHYVSAFLTVSYGTEESKNYSNVGVLNVADSSKHYKYSLSGDRDALFVNGTEYKANGTGNKIDVLDATLTAGHKMEVFWIDETALTLNKNSSVTLGREFHDFEVDTNTDVVTVKYSGKYNIYFTSGNAFYFTKKIYLNGSTNWNVWDNATHDTYMQMQRVGSNTGSEIEIKMESTGRDNEYYAFVDTTDYQNAQFHLSNNQKWTNFWGTDPLKTGKNYFSYPANEWSTYVED